MWINRGLDVSRGYNPDAISPDQMMSGPNVNQPGAAIRMTSATPTMQQRIKALGVATPIALSSPVRRYASNTSLVHCNFMFGKKYGQTIGGTELCSDPPKCQILFLFTLSQFSTPFFRRKMFFCSFFLFT